MKKKISNMEELYRLESKYPAIEFQWDGIRSDSPEKGTNKILGIQLLKNKGGSILLGNESIKDKYPAFFILD